MSLLTSKKAKCVHYWICTSSNNGSVKQVCKLCEKVVIIEPMNTSFAKGENTNNWMQSKKKIKK